MKLNHIGFLDGFRFIYAFWVVVAHFYTMIGGAKLYKPNNFIYKLLSTPIIAVYGFMVITGFLMMYNAIHRANEDIVNDKSAMIKFWLRRFFRLYPVYIVILTVAFFVFESFAKRNADALIFFTGTDVTFGGFVRPTAPPVFADYITHAFLIHGLLPQYQESILGVAWSLSTEAQFYFVFPFLIPFLFRNEVITKKRLLPAVLITIIMMVLTNKLLGGISSVLGVPIFRLPSVLTSTFPFFLLGMIMAGVKLKRLQPVYLAASLLFIALFQNLITNFTIIAFTTILFLDELEIVLPPIVFKILSWFRSLISGKLAGYGADISYSVYLIHTLVISQVLTLVIALSKSFPMSKLTAVVLSFVLTLCVCAVLGYLISRFIEKPFIEFGKQVVNKIKGTSDLRQVPVND